MKRGQTTPPQADRRGTGQRRDRHGARSAGAYLSAGRAGDAERTSTPGRWCTRRTCRWCCTATAAGRFRPAIDAASGRCPRMRRSCSGPTIRFSRSGRRSRAAVRAPQRRRPGHQRLESRAGAGHVRPRKRRPRQHRRRGDPGFALVPHALHIRRRHAANRRRSSAATTCIGPRGGSCIRDEPLNIAAPRGRT